MKLKYLLFLLILLMLFSGIASAIGGPSTPNMTFSSSKEWLIANNADSAVLTLRDNNYPVQAVTVKFDVNNTDMATVNPAPITVGTDGIATSLIYSKTKSGTVEVYANVTYKYDRSNASEPLKYLYYSILQKIDHDTPYAIAPDDTFPDGVVNVGTELPITIHITDYWGNRVENRNPAILEKINMSVQGSPGDLAVLKNGGSWVKAVEIPVDSQGNFNTTLKMSTRPGFHSILVVPLGMPISEKPYYVRGIANGVPTNILSHIEIAEGGIGSAAVTPPYIEADGFSRYFITYTLYDEFGNPVSDRIVNFSTTIPGEQQFLPATTDLGEVKIYYGPKDQVGTVTLNAVSIDNPNAQVNNTVKFINSTATEMLITANPETMPSIDAVVDFRAEIRAKVVDDNGNGVPNETVVFSMGTPAYAENYTITSPPALVDYSPVTTDSDGYATNYFIPGGFTTTWGDPKYDDTATGRVTVTATWNSTPRNILLTWKNYPYLSAETFATPNVVNVTDNVTVTLWLKGDGWALQPKPIDVVMCTDRSGSMLLGSPDRMTSAMTASKLFNSKMNPIRDRVGLVSFGDPSGTGGWAKLAPTWTGSSWSWTNVYGGHYADHNPPHSEDVGWWWVGTDTSYDSNPDSYSTSSVHQQYINTYYKGNPRNYGTTTMATVEQTLSFNHTTVNNSIDQMVPSGGTPMREGLYRAVKMLRENPRSGAVPAVILLSDGDWNTGGNPKGASGAVSFPADGITSSTSIIDWAKQKNISIYTIGLGVSPTTAAYLTDYATQTGGKYYNAATAADLDTIYTSIAGDLQTEAGVATNADLNYGTVNVNQVATSGVFDYVYKNGVSTMVKSYWKNETLIYGPDYYDQTADWSDKVLSFNVGTVKLNQTWMTSYMLKVNKPGNIDVFGPGSYISFNGNTSQLLLPKTLITALPDMSTTGGVNVTKTLTINNLTAVVNEDDNIADLSVDIQILPSSPNLSVVADIYITDGDQHTTTWIKSVELAPVVNGRMHITSIDLSQYQRGKQYTFYVDFVNKQPGTNPVYWAQLSSNNFVMMKKPAGVYIRLE
jgi:Mg-chelatase subunit ChlD